MTNENKPGYLAGDKYLWPFAGVENLLPPGFYGGSAEYILVHPEQVGIPNEVNEIKFISRQQWAYFTIRGKPNLLYAQPFTDVSNNRGYSTSLTEKALKSLQDNKLIQWPFGSLAVVSLTTTDTQLWVLLKDEQDRYSINKMDVSVESGLFFKDEMAYSVLFPEAISGPIEFFAQKESESSINIFFYAKDHQKVFYGKHRGQKDRNIHLVDLAGATKNITNIDAFHMYTWDGILQVAILDGKNEKLRVFEVDKEGIFKFRKMHALDKPYHTVSTFIFRPGSLLEKPAPQKSKKDREIRLFMLVSDNGISTLNEEAVTIYPLIGLGADVVPANLVVNKKLHDYKLVNCKLLGLLSENVIFFRDYSIPPKTPPQYRPPSLSPEKPPASEDELPLPRTYVLLTRKFKTVFFDKTATGSGNEPKGESARTKWDNS